MKRLTIILIWLAAAVCVMAEEAMVSTLSYRRFTTQDGLPQMQTEAIWQDERGYIYVGTLSGFVRYDGRVFTPLLRGRRENIVGFREVEGQVRALGFRRQWLVKDKEVRMRPIDAEGKWLLNNLNAMDLPEDMVLLEDEEEEHRRLCHMTADGFTTLTDNPILDAMTPDRKLFVDKSGIYVPTPQGLYKLTIDNAQCTIDNAHEKLVTTKPDIFSLLRQGERLYALAADGIYGIEDDSLRPVLAYRFEAPDYGLMARGEKARREVDEGRGKTGMRDGSEGGEVPGQARNEGARGGAGTVFVVDAHSVYEFDGCSIRVVAKGFNLIRCLFIDRWDRLWVGSYQGVYCFFRQYFTNHRLTDGNDIARALGVTAGDHLVCGTLNGKLLIDGKVVWENPNDFFIPSSAVVDGKVYMASRNDVACVDSNGRMTWLHLPFDRYRFVAAAGDRLVFGSRQTVLSYDPATGETDTLSAYIRQPWCAAMDGQGHLYVGSSTGVHCVEVKGSRKSSEGGRGSSPRGGRNKGVTRRIDDRGQFFVTTMAAGADGNVYLAAADSVFMIDDGQLSYLPIAGLSGHEVRSLHVSRDNVLVVATIDALFVAELGGQTAGRCNEGRFRLGGRNEGREQRVFDHLSGFSMIEPQQAVMAETADGTVWMAGLEEMTSFRPAELLTDNGAETFVAPPLAWWQHWWVMYGFVLLGIMVLVGLMRLIVRRRLRRIERDRREKELQISAIRLKAIPHFHSNVLAGIEYFLMNGSTEDATRYLKLYSDFTNLTLTDIDRASRNVAEEVEYARIYLELEKLRYGERLAFDIDVSEDFPADTQIPNMVIYTYAQNAVKHGIAPKPDGGHINIRVGRHGDNVVIEVEDDGIGREAAQKVSQQSTKQGLRILMDQVGLYNHRNRKPITQRVDDLRDVEGKAAGTRFVMCVPMGYVFRV